MKKILTIFGYLFAVLFSLISIGFIFSNDLVSAMGVFLFALVFFPYTHKYLKKTIRKKRFRTLIYTFSLVIGFLLFGIGSPSEPILQSLINEINESDLTQEEKELFLTTLKSLDKDEDTYLAFKDDFESQLAQNQLENELDSKITAVPTETSSSDTIIPAYFGKSSVAINNNIPFFNDSDLTTEAFEHYSDFDSLGRAGVAYANISKELMPTEKRKSIGMIQPSGWHTVRYDSLIEGKYLYNRCHLIGFQLAGENANEKNLITGTRYFNTEGMLPFENMVSDYVKETGNHVLYRVTPIYTNENLVADGVLMEAKSVEDQGEGISFNVFVYNVQPNISIDYATGESKEGDPQLSPAQVPDSLLEQYQPSNSKEEPQPEPVYKEKPQSEPVSKEEPQSEPVSKEDPQPEPVVPQETTQTTVWIASSGKGKKYHKKSKCGNMKNALSITLEEAQRRNFQPCSNCY